MNTTHISNEFIKNVKNEKVMAKKIRMILKNSGFNEGQILEYEDIKQILEPFKKAGAFAGFEDKYGEEKDDKTLDGYIRHQFQGLVQGEDKKKLNQLIRTGPEKNGKYEFMWKKINSIGVDEDMMDYDKERVEQKIKNLINSDIKQIILTGAPGTGKTYMAQEIAKEIVREQYSKINNVSFDDLDEARQEEIYNKHMGFVQFHPSYDYTDFVEGLRPVKNRDSATIGFELRDGIFRQFCNKAKEDENSKYFFIIDEINRADLSKVFGELMYGLEEDYRGRQFDTQYSSLRKDMEQNGEDIDVKFTIPKNVYIIGTMNDIDRSVETFDFALRRRFVWVEIDANKMITGSKSEKFSFDKSSSSLYQMISDKIDKIKENNDKEIKFEESKEENMEDLARSAFGVNEVISTEGKDFNLNKHFHLGPAYFGKIDLTKDYKEGKEELWDIRIEPILREYVRGYDTSKINKFIEDCREKFLPNGRESENGDKE